MFDRIKTAIATFVGKHNVSGIVSEFTSTIAKLEAAAEHHANVASIAHAAMVKARDAKAAAFVEVERAERIAQKLKDLFGAQ